MPLDNRVCINLVKILFEEKTGPVKLALVTLEAPCPHGAQASGLNNSNGLSVQPSECSNK